MFLERFLESSLTITLQELPAVLLLAEFELDDQVRVTTVNFQYVHPIEATRGIWRGRNDNHQSKHEFQEAAL